VLGSALSTRCQDKVSPIIEATKEIGVSFSPSLIAYREYNASGTELDSEHGWISGGEVKAGVPFQLCGAGLLSEAIYQYDDGSSKHFSPATGEYPAALISNDMFVGIGPTFTPTPRFSWTPEADVEYREWHRGIPKAKYEVIEHYTFWAPGGGVRASYNPVGRLVVTVRAGLAHTVFPKNAGIGNPVGAVPNVTFSLGTRNVWQANFGADYPIFQRLHAFAGIDYSHFGFGVSEFESGGPVYTPQQEPNSVTDLAKVNVGFAWFY